MKPVESLEQSKNQSVDQDGDISAENISQDIAYIYDRMQSEIVPQLNEFLIKLELLPQGNSETQYQYNVNNLSSEINKTLLLTSKVFEIMSHLKAKNVKLQQRVAHQYQELKMFG